MVAIFSGCGEAERVGVEKGILRPGKNFAGFHIGNEHSAPFGFSFAHGFRDDFFRDELDLDVQGKVQILPLGCAGTVSIKPAPCAVTLYDVFLRRSGKKIIE